MKMKTLLFSFLFFSLITHAQDSSFQLKDYKYRTDGYRALSLDINFSGRNYYYKPYRDSTEKSNEIRFDVGSINYNKIVSKEKRVHSSTFNLNPAFNIKRYERSGVKGKENLSQHYLNWSRNDRFYIKNKLFLELNNKLNSFYYKTKSKQGTANSNFNQINIDEELSLGFGKGRIEYVQDAQMALFIINDLKNQGLITANLDAATTYQLAQLITDINNRRIFDYRRRRIYELTQISNFLKEKGIVSEPDIRYFTTINDNWALALNPFRASGAAWFVRVKPKAGYNKIERLYEIGYSYQQNQKYYGFSPEIGYENFKPISLKWQRDFGASVDYYHNNSEIENQFSMGTPSYSKEKIKEAGTHIQSFYALGFYPNNRTQLNGKLNLLLGGLDVFKSQYIHPSFEFGANYFLGYRTRLYASASASSHINLKSYTSPMFDAYDHQLLTSFSMSLLHSFF